MNKSRDVMKETGQVRFSREEIERVLDELVAEGELKRFINEQGQVSYIAAKFVN